MDLFGFLYQIKTQVLTSQQLLILKNKINHQGYPLWIGSSKLIVEGYQLGEIPNSLFRKLQDLISHRLVMFIGDGLVILYIESPITQSLDIMHRRLTDNIDLQIKIIVLPGFYGSCRFPNFGFGTREIQFQGETEDELLDDFRDQLSEILSDLPISFRHWLTTPILREKFTVPDFWMPVIVPVTKITVIRDVDGYYGSGRYQGISFHFEGETLSELLQDFYYVSPELDWVSNKYVTEKFLNLPVGGGIIEL